MESSHRLHQDQPGLRALLRGAHGKTVAGHGQPNYVNGFEVATHEHAAVLPLAWKKPRNIFVNSMSDLFHPACRSGSSGILRRHGAANWHQYQLLTKRSERLLEMDSQLSWLPNI